jgi:AraC-like DNA-binding protein
MLREIRDERLTLREVAREADMSPFHFIRQFEAVFGSSPHQFRIGTRLERAKQLLAMGGYSVTDVCMEVGFSSLGSFSQLFARGGVYTRTHADGSGQHSGLRKHVWQPHPALRAGAPRLSTLRWTRREQSAP